MKKLTLLIAISTLKFVIAQETIGLIYNDVNEIKSDGYTLFSPLSDDRVFLINNCGEVVNQWDFSGQFSISSYLLESGNLLQSNRHIADIRDWDNNVLWSINYDNLFGFETHHDIEPLPNGNFLVMIRDNYTAQEMFDEGMDTSFSGTNFILDRIVEIEPVGTNSANIVWEWKFFDHIIQDFDSSKPNFGNISDNPQLLDINYDAFNIVDYVHTNGLDYNSSLDQIVISARHTHEIYVIDHSTSTTQAATSSGGLYGKGGDFLWRWGNPEVYDRGTIVDRKIGKQHDPKWVEEGPFQGMISVFSNDGYGSNLSASSVHIIEPDDVNGVYNLSLGEFLPNDYFWSWDGVITGDVMFGASRCGVQVMSNGNVLIDETGKGKLSEVNNLGNVIWVYEIPAASGSNFSQFSEAVNNGAFRANRYSESYPGFNGVTFNNSGIIENQNSISDDCINLLSVEDVFFSELKVYPNPVSDVLNFEFNELLDKIEVYSITGQLVLSQSDSKLINVESLTKGIYVVNVSVDNNSEFIKIIKD